MNQEKKLAQYELVSIEDKNINRLTVIANESFEEFAKGLQLEYAVSGNGDNYNKPNNGIPLKAKRKYDIDDGLQVGEQYVYDEEGNVIGKEWAEFGPMEEALKELEQIVEKMDTLSHKLSIVWQVEEPIHNNGDGTFSLKL